MIRCIVAVLLMCSTGRSQPASVAELAVADLNGAPVTIRVSNNAATVVAFISTLCPVSNAFNDRMTALYNDYSSKGVQFAFINSNANESSAEVTAHSKGAGFPFAVYRDPSNRIATQLGAAATPETYVIDKGGMVRYHGYIEDSPNEARVKRHALRAALDAVLSGNPVPVAATKAFGCTIKRAIPK